MFGVNVDGQIVHSTFRHRVFRNDPTQGRIASCYKQSDVDRRLADRRLADRRLEQSLQLDEDLAIYTICVSLTFICLLIIVLVCYPRVAIFLAVFPLLFYIYIFISAAKRQQNLPHLDFDDFPSF